MSKFNVDKNRCKGCKLCVPVCPKKILKMSDEMNDYGNRYVICIDDNQCIMCGLCASVCPDWAININKTETVKER